MTTQNTPDEIKSEVFESLKKTRYASTSLKSLSGGNANFIYLSRLSKSLEDATAYVVVKHGEAYMAAFPENNLTIDRCGIEVQCLEELGPFRIKLDQVSAFRYIVRTPRCYLYDNLVHTQVQEYLPDSVTLKAYILNNFASPTPESLQPQCHDLGKALGTWITGFHHKTDSEIKQWSIKKGDEPKPNLYTALETNKDMQKLKHMINYDWLLQRVDQFPDILGEAKEVFEEVKKEAMRELNGAPEDLTSIHGDLCAGNILLPNRPIQKGIDIPIFVVDWENAQLGVHSLDHGEMIGELYALWLYKKIDAVLWMIQGYVEGLGEQTDTSAWRVAIQVGCHLVSFGTIYPGWGTPDQVECVARVGKNVIMNAWQRNRKCFEGNELACLFPK